GIDIGSSAIRGVVSAAGEGGAGCAIIGVAEVSAAGVTKGSVTSIDDAVSSLSLCLEQLERMAGVPVESAYIGITTPSIASIPSRGVIAVSRADGEIREEDVERVIEAAQAVATPPNSEILHVIPRTFSVDQQTGIKDPVGMTGVRLEVEAKIVQGLSGQIRNLTKAVFRTGIDIDDVVFSVLAAGEAALTPRQKELGVAVVDIGSSLTSLAVFEEGDLLATSIIPLGGSHVTSDIAIGLRTSLDVAEKLKREYGRGIAAHAGKRDEVNLGDYSATEHEQVSVKHICEIIEARLEEIFEFVDRELVKCGRSGMLPAGIVLTGGGAKLPDLIEVAKKVCRLPASLGLSVNVTSAIDKAQDPTFTTACGLALWGHALARGKGGSAKFAPAALKELPRQAMRWLRSLLP
ncbi:cell division protein FtsA, partial [Candidatus Uhrbacteria bacterium RIFCSPHIGHO2_12_FULL_54_23]